MPPWLQALPGTTRTEAPASLASALFEDGRSTQVVLCVRQTGRGESLVRAAFQAEPGMRCWLQAPPGTMDTEAPASLASELLEDGSSTQVVLCMRQTGRGESLVGTAFQAEPGTRYWLQAPPGTTRTEAPASSSSALFEDGSSTQVVLCMRQTRRGESLVGAAFQAEPGTRLQRLLSTIGC